METVRNAIDETVKEQHLSAGHGSERERTLTIRTVASSLSVTDFVLRVAFLMRDLVWGCDI